MSNSQTMIRAIMAPLAADHLLLPSNVVAEVIGFAKPTPHVDSPPWLLGDLEWSSWQVPIISYAMLCGASDKDPVTSNSRILVIKTLTQETSLNYLGILISGLPKLKKLAPESLQPAPDERLTPVVFSRVALEDQFALVPELQTLTEQVAEVLQEA
jgi:chemosensory pili system protein ChpC